METEEVSQLQTKKKEPSRKAAAQKKPLPTVSESHDDDDIQIIDDDDDFVPDEKKKKGGRKPGNAKAAKPPSTKKRGPAASKQSQTLGQKLITEVLKPAENSPEKKVRKVRASPFNKKSGSILGRTINVEEEEEGSTSAEQADSTSTLGSVTDVGQAVAPKARPQRANRGKATYVISDDSESDDPAEDFESDAAEDYSDFDDED